MPDLTPTQKLIALQHYQYPTDGSYDIKEVPGGYQIVPFNDDTNPLQSPTSMVERQQPGYGGNTAAQQDNNSSALGAAGRGFLSSALPAMAGSGGAAIAAGLAPESGGLSLAVPLLAGIGSSLLASYGQKKAINNLLPTTTAQAINTQLAQDESQHPIASALGGASAMMAGGLNPSIANILRAGKTATLLPGMLAGGTRLAPEELANLGNVALGAGIQGGIAAGQDLYQGAPAGQVTKDALIQSALGSLFNKPNTLGESLYRMHPEISTANPQMQEAREMRLNPYSREMSAPVERQAATTSDIVPPTEQQPIPELSGGEVREPNVQLPPNPIPQDNPLKGKPKDIRETYAPWREQATEQPPITTIVLSDNPQENQQKQLPPWFDWASRLFKSTGDSRNINFDITTGQLRNSKGVEVNGLAYLRQGIQEAAAKLSPNQIDTFFHEPGGHIFFNDLLNSPHPRDRQVAQNMLNVVQRDPRYTEWSKEAGYNPTDPKTTEEFLAQGSGEYFKSQVGKPIEGFKPAMQELISTAKLRYGGATSEDAYRILHNRYFKDPDFYYTHVAPQIAGRGGSSDIREQPTSKDMARYRELQEAMSRLNINDPQFDTKFAPIFKEMEDIKNRNQGYAPGTEPPREQPKNQQPLGDADENDIKTGDFNSKGWMADPKIAKLRLQSNLKYESDDGLLRWKEQNEKLINSGETASFLKNEIDEINKEIARRKGGEEQQIREQPKSQQQAYNDEQDRLYKSYADKFKNYNNLEELRDQEAINIDRLEKEGNLTTPEADMFRMRDRESNEAFDNAIETKKKWQQINDKSPDQLERNQPKEQKPISEMRGEELGQKEHPEYGNLKNWFEQVHMPEASKAYYKAKEGRIDEAREALRNLHEKVKEPEDQAAYLRKRTRFIDNMVEGRPREQLLHQQPITKEDKELLGRTFAPTRPSIDSIRATIPTKQGQYLAGQFTKTYNEQQTLNGRWTNKLNAAQADLSPAQRNNVRRALEIGQEGKYNASSMLRTTKEVQAYNKIRAVLDDIHPQAEHYFPSAVDRNVAQTIRSNKPQDASKIAGWRDDFIDKQQQGGETLEAAKKNWEDLVGTIRKDLGRAGATNQAYFQGEESRVDRIPLPDSMREKDLGRLLEFHARKMAASRTWENNIRGDEEAAKAVGYTKDTQGKVYEGEPNSLMGNEHVRNVVQHFRGEVDPYGLMHTPATHAAESLATTVMLGPLTEVHRDISSIAKVASEVGPLDAFHTIYKGITDNIAGWRRSVNTGLASVSRNTVRDNIRSLVDTSSSVTDKLTALRDLARKTYTLGGTTDRFLYGFLQASGEHIINSKLARARAGDKDAATFLRYFDPDFKQGQTRYSPDEISIMASRFANTIHGSYDPRTLPGYMTKDTEISAFLKLANWQVSSTNSWMRNVWTPATKGNIVPLMTSLMGSVLGGYAIKKAREELGGSKTPVPSLEELFASAANKKKGLYGKSLKENKDMLAYSGMELASLAGFGGIITSALKGVDDELHKNKFAGMGTIFPLDEVATSTAEIGSHALAGIRQALDAGDVQEAFNVASRAFMDWLKQNVQVAKVGLNQLEEHKGVNPEDYARHQYSQRTQDLRRFEMASGLPYENQSSLDTESNPYLTRQENVYKRDLDISHALQEELPSIIHKYINLYGDKPMVLMQKLEALKQNEYETEPSIDTKPADFTSYQEWLKTTRGEKEATDRLMDYMRHHIANEVKSDILP